jgi:hypothetical protein
MECRVRTRVSIDPVLGPHLVRGPAVEYGEGYTIPPEGLPFLDHADRQVDR